MQFVRLEPDQAPNEGGSVFSSTGDIIRKAAFPPEDAKFGRSTGHGARNLVRSAASAAALVAQGLFATLFPSDCRFCATPLTNISRLPVCPSCLMDMVPITGATCEICGERLGAAGFVAEKQICPACQETRQYFTKAAAYGAYDGGLRDLIHLLKYERVAPAAVVLGRMLGEAIQKLRLGADSILVIPVPLHSSKRRERGFNQAAMIARAALKTNTFSCEFAADVLERTRPTVSQIGLTRPQRVENIRGAFRVWHPSKVSGRNILLIDDVLTTGTTVSECARILRKAGAEKVWVATVARTLKESGFESGRFFPKDATIAQAS
ncbi:MAG: ComF family protein [Acidobacteriaceae bacterium]|nr:ComF family protein [Acidobacteriaceae bacterium]